MGKMFLLACMKLIRGKKIVVVMRLFFRVAYGNYFMKEVAEAVH